MLAQARGHLRKYGCGSRLRRPLRSLPDEATSGVVNDTTLAKPPPLWIPAFAGMTVVQRSPFAGTTASKDDDGFRPAPERR